MGYRNPATSATAVDTSNGRPGVPGARMYAKQTAPGVFQGVVEWTDGYATAQATLTGGGFQDSGGNVFALAGGGIQGVAAPRLLLNVEQLPNGQYAPRARVTEPWQPIATGFPTWRNGWKDFPGGGSFERPRFVLLADGSVLFSGLAQNGSGSSQGGVGGDAWIGTAPTGFAPPVTTLLQAVGQSGSNYRIDLNPDGTIHIGDSPALISGGYLNFRGLYRLDSTPT